MLSKILKKIFGSSSKQEVESLKNEFSSSEETAFQPVAFIELGKYISNNNPEVLAKLNLYTDDSKKYFEKYKDDLGQRSIETSEEISPEVVLIDALISTDKIVYTDHDTEGDDVLTMLDNLVDGVLSKQECFNELSEVYKSKGKYNAIGNFIHDEQHAPMLHKCIKSAGYYLVGIDEDSDSYALFLVDLESESKIKKLANEAGVKIQYSTN